LIREEDKLVQFGVINTAGPSNKALVAQQKDKPKYPKKQHPRYNKKQHKGPKPTQTTSTPTGDKGAKYKSNNTNRHCNFCDKDGHDESKCFKKMAALEAAMKKHNINIDSTSSSHRHALFALVSPSIQILQLLLLLMSGLLIQEHLIIWLRIKPYLLL
jgi:hypothetical protein